MNVRNLISPIILGRGPNGAAEYFNDAPSSSSSVTRASAMTKFAERYGKKIYWHLCENRIGDRLLEVWEDLPAFSAFMDSTSASGAPVNYFKAVINRPADARQFLGKGDLLSSEQDIALNMSKIPLPDCCSPDKLEAVCSMGISCIANTCKILTSLNVVECQSSAKDAAGG